MGFKLVSRGEGDLKTRYRPQTLDEVVPTCSIKRLKSLLTDANSSRVFLFEGESGSGKTTTARILARTVVCESDKDKPCLKCNRCKGLTRSADFSEINIADLRRIEDIRDMVDGMRYFPIDLNKKIYILDEVHQLTPASQQLLLKVLEEPPEHVLVFLCTTEKKGLKRTLLDRATTISFRRSTKTQAASVVKQVITAEGREAPDEDTVASFHARSDGSVRALLNHLQEFLEGDYDASVGVDGEATEDIRELAKALMDRKWAKVSAILKQDYVRKSPESVRISVTCYLRAVCLNKPQAADTVPAARALDALIGPLVEEASAGQYNELIVRCIRVFKKSAG